MLLIRPTPDRTIPGVLYKIGLGVACSVCFSRRGKFNAEVPPIGCAKDRSAACMFLCIPCPLSYVIPLLDLNAVVKQVYQNHDENSYD